MSRSYRKPSYYTCAGINPRAGKQITSRRIRRKAAQLCHVARFNYITWDFWVDVQDRKRGHKGSRCPDWGWDYFGDGGGLSDFIPLARFNYKESRFAPPPYRDRRVPRYWEPEDWFKWSRKLICK